MTATLFLTPTTDAALSHACELVRAAQAQSHLTPISFLLPTGDAIQQLRHRLGDVMGVRLLQFYNLGSAILAQADSTVREMSDTARRRLVHALLGETVAWDELTTFRPVWDKPGFTDVLVEWLREMKTQGIPPEDVATHARTSGNERDRQLALLYTRYQTFLRDADCADADGLLWLAAEALENDPRLFAGAGQLLLLGFDQFSPVQLRILRALASRLPQLSIYLRWDAARPTDSLALSRLNGTREALIAALAPKVELLVEGDGSPATLDHLRCTLFEPYGRMTADGDPPAVVAVAAPSRESEVRWALRTIKQLLLDGVSAEQIALLAPHPDVYAGIVTAVAEEYGVPVASETELAQAPAVAALLNLVSLSPDFLWRATFDALRSPYIQQPWLKAAQIDLLDRLTRERPVVAGREQWRFALQPLPPRAADEAAAAEADADEDLGPPPLTATLPPEELARLEAGLMAFFDHLSPPSQAAHHAYTLWLQEALLGLFTDEEGEGAAAGPMAERPTLGLLDCCQQGAYAERDLSALAAALRGLRDLVEAAELVLPGQDTIVPWEVYRTDVLEILPAVRLRSDPSYIAVRFGPLEAGRAVAVDHLFVLDMGEGEFPRPPRPDPFYTSAEREAHPLPLLRLQPADDACLWWQALANCRRTLTLLRPRLDESGAPWLPSAYWDAVVDLIDGLNDRIAAPKIGATPGIHEAASPAELIEALAVSGAAAVPPELARPWRAIETARRVMDQRRGWAPPAAFEGMLSAPDLLADLDRRYGAGRAWSVSRLNRYGACPYSFFAQETLGLEPRPDPEEGIDPRQRGSLLHAILERLYKRLTAEGLAPSPEDQDRILACLDDACAALLPMAPARYGFRPGPLWEHEQVETCRQLRALVAWECEPRNARGYRPHLQELRFGLPGPTGIVPKASLPRLHLAGSNGQVFDLHGVIDRVDRDVAGRWRVIDYKSGSAAFSEADILAGRALQSALYALAAERLLPGGAPVAETYYVHIAARKNSGRVECPGGAASDPIVAAAVERAAGFVEAVRAGRFTAAPSKSALGGGSCAHACDFAALCRVTRQGIRKAREVGLA